MKDLLKRLLRFASVGVIATLTHIVVAGAVHWLAELSPQASNLCGFLVACLVTYFGNQAWTFEGRARHGRAAWRFPVLAGLSLGTSSLVTWVAIDLLSLGYAGALVLVGIAVPAVSFFVANFWVFKADEGASLRER